MPHEAAIGIRMRQLDFVGDMSKDTRTNSDQQAEDASDTEGKILERKTNETHGLVSPSRFQQGVLYGSTEMLRWSSNDGVSHSIPVTVVQPKSCKKTADSKGSTKGTSDEKSLPHSSEGIIGLLRKSTPIWTNIFNHEIHWLSLEKFDYAASEKKNPEKYINLCSSDSGYHPILAKGFQENRTKSSKIQLSDCLIYGYESSSNKYRVKWLNNLTEEYQHPIKIYIQNEEVSYFVRRLLFADYYRNLMEKQTLESFKIFCAPLGHFKLEGINVDSLVKRLDQLKANMNFIDPSIFDPKKILAGASELAERLTIKEYLEQACFYAQPRVFLSENDDSLLSKSYSPAYQRLRQTDARRELKIPGVLSSTRMKINCFYNNFTLVELLNSLIEACRIIENTKFVFEMENSQGQVFEIYKQKVHEKNFEIQEFISIEVLEKLKRLLQQFFSVYSLKKKQVSEKKQLKDSEIEKKFLRFLALKIEASLSQMVLSSIKDYAMFISSENFIFKDSDLASQPYKLEANINFSANDSAYYIPYIVIEIITDVNSKAIICNPELTIVIDYLAGLPKSWIYSVCRMPNPSYLNERGKKPFSTSKIELDMEKLTESTQNFEDLLSKALKNYSNYINTIRQNVENYNSIISTECDSNEEFFVREGDRAFYSAESIKNKISKINTIEENINNNILDSYHMGIFKISCKWIKKHYILYLKAYKTKIGTPLLEWYMKRIL